MVPGTEVWARLPSHELCQRCVFHHVFSRPQFGGLHSGQDRWRGPSLERSLPFEQAAPLERGPLPEQPYQMTPEHSKFGGQGKVEENVLTKSQRSSGPIVPLHCRHLTIPKAPVPPPQCQRTKSLHSASSKTFSIPRGPRER